MDSTSPLTCDHGDSKGTGYGENRRYLQPIIVAAVEDKSDSYERTGKHSTRRTGQVNEQITQTAFTNLRRLWASFHGVDIRTEPE